MGSLHERRQGGRLLPRASGPTDRRTNRGEAVSPTILCRRILSDLGEPVKYCCQPIEVRNALDWCEADRSRLPLWPTDEVETTEEK